MVSTHPEVVVWGVLVLLYLSDLATLLFLNELLLFSAAGTFTARVVHCDVTIRKKLLYVLNPFLPHVLAFRVPWGIQSRNGARAETERRSIRRCTHDLSWPARLCATLGATLFLAFPVLSILVGFNKAFVFCSILGYGLLLVMVGIWVARRGSPFVAAEKAALLIILSFVCIPLAVNLSRRLSLLVEIESDASDLLPGLLDSRGYEQLWSEVVGRAEKEIGLGLDATAEDNLRRYINEASPS